MIKRLLKKNSEQLVKKFEYHKVALQKELDERQQHQQQQARRAENTYMYASNHNNESYSPRYYPLISGSNYPSTYYPPNNIRMSPLESHLHSPPSHITNTTTVRSTDLYNGSKETFL